MLTIDSQTLLQVISTRGIMSDDELSREVLIIFGQTCSTEIVNEINRKIKCYNLVIKSAVCEFTGRKYWIFTSSVIDKSMTFLVNFTKPQINFAYKLFNEVIYSEEGHLSIMTCINLRSQMASAISPNEAERLINQLVDAMWLKNMDGQIYMGIRSIGGLMPFFKDYYADGLKVCPICSSTVFYGHKCQECDIVAHLYCLSRAQHYQRKALKCMNCKATLQINAAELPEIIEEELMEVDLNEDVISQKCRRSQRNQKSQNAR